MTSLRDISSLNNRMLETVQNRPHDPSSITTPSTPKPTTPSTTTPTTKVGDGGTTTTTPYAGGSTTGGITLHEVRNVTVNHAYDTGTGSAVHNPAQLGMMSWSTWGTSSTGQITGSETTVGHITPREYVDGLMKQHLMNMTNEELQQQLNGMSREEAWQYYNDIVLRREKYLQEAGYDKNPYFAFQIPVEGKEESVGFLNQDGSGLIQMMRDAAPYLGAAATVTANPALFISFLAIESSLTALDLIQGNYKQAAADGFATLVAGSAGLRGMGQAAQIERMTAQNAIQSTFRQAAPQALQEIGSIAPYAGDTIEYVAPLTRQAIPSVIELGRL